MNKTIIILTTLLMNISLLATTTRIKVCNNLKKNSSLQGGEIGVWVNTIGACANHKNEHLAQGSCDSWLIGGCDTEVEVWFPNSWMTTIHTTLVHGQYEISAEQIRLPNDKWAYVAKVRTMNTYGDWENEGPYRAEKR